MAKNRASLEPKPSSDADHSSCDDVSLEKWSSLKSDCAQIDLTIGDRTIWKLFIVATKLELAFDQHVAEYKKYFKKIGYHTLPMPSRTSLSPCWYLTNY
jgi:hypothetical protein